MRFIFLTFYGLFFILSADIEGDTERSYPFGVPFIRFLTGKGVIAMVCKSVRAGSECALMTEKGCSYNGGSCHPTVEACTGCNKVLELPLGNYCLAYPEPALKWRNGRSCNFATHLKPAEKRESSKLNPLKASKRRNAGR